MKELCSIKWSFHFKNHELDQFDIDESNQSWISIFHEDFTMTSALHNQLMTWNFVEYNGTTHIQVEQYPPLRQSRCADGSWRMENMYVFFLQTEPLQQETLPLF